MGKRVAVIVLNWNGAKLLHDFLPSVVRNTNPELGQVIVADNASTDRSVEYLTEEFPEVRQLLLDKNHGFAGGYNRAIAQVEAEYIVLLNSDVEVSPGWLEPLVKVLDEDPRVAGVQPKIRSWRERDKFEYAGACGGFIDYLGFPFCRGRLLNTLETDRGQYDDITEVFWASGAALCIRRDLYLQAGGLDEAFFAHMEEIDLCWRLKNRAYAFKVVPASVVYHLGGGTLPMNHPRKLFLNYRNNLLMLYKNYGKRHRKSMFFVRFILDMMASFVFLLKGEWSNAASVYRAYSDYRKKRKDYIPDPGKEGLPGIYRKSLIGSYFICGKRKFAELKINR